MPVPTRDGIAVRDDRTARLALACVTNPADSRIADLLAVEDPLTLWHSLSGRRADSTWGRRVAGVRLDVVLAAMRRHDLRFVVPGDDEWPDRLEDLVHAEWAKARGRPLGLWVTGPGHLAHWSDRSVAIVGSRASTAYGEAVASDLGADLAATGVTVVSGGAYGIDISAHRGALAAGGRTITILAGGLDNPYPRGNRRVLDAVRATGLLVSEQPPGERPSRMRFLWRNRIIAALTGGTVVVEAANRSGAKNTVSWADACSRPILAVPGPVTSACSEGAHELIREGATLVANAAHIREAVAPMGQETLPLEQGPARPVDRLSEMQMTVFDVVPGRGGRTAEEIAIDCGVPLLVTISVLGELEDVGFVERSNSGRWKMKSGSVG